MDIKSNIEKIKKETGPSVTLVAVSKTKPIEDIREAYAAGQLDFGENKVQELTEKESVLPKDIRWHMIGHLQTNKVKYIAPFVHLIHSVDSEKLLKEINKQGKKQNRIINCLLQVHIASEETKYGWDENELNEFLTSGRLAEYENIYIQGLMGMATFTEDQRVVRNEFKGLNTLFNKLKTKFQFPNLSMETLSMGMSGDYALAVEEGSTMIRVGSSIFGNRNYNL